MELYLNMNRSISEKVKVNLDQNSKPANLIYKNRFYEIKKQGFHYTYKVGANLIHVFCVTTKSMFFKLELDTSNLHWKITEMSEAV